MTEIPLVFGRAVFFCRRLCVSGYLDISRSILKSEHRKITVILLLDMIYESRCAIKTENTRISMLRVMTVSAWYDRIK